MTIEKTSFACQRGNLTLRGVEYRPPGSGLPIAIVCHGFMANHRTVLQYVRLFASLGYAAYAFDFCGGCAAGGKSDGRTVDMSVLSEVEDLKAVIDHTAALPYTNPDSLLLMGCSQGGFVCALTAAQLRDRVKKLVLFFPALCIPDDARAGQMMFARFDPANPPDTFFCGPMKLGKSYVTDVIGMDPFAQIAPYPGDVLIVHGTKDKLVNLRYSETAYDVYAARASGTASLRRIDEAGHMFTRKQDAQAIGHVRDFLAGLPDDGIRT